ESKFHGDGDCEGAGKICKQRLRPGLLPGVAIDRGNLSNGLLLGLGAMGWRTRLPVDRQEKREGHGQRGTAAHGTRSRCLDPRVATKNGYTHFFRKCRRRDTRRSSLRELPAVLLNE